jgi:hypothetical protein
LHGCITYNFDKLEIKYNISNSVGDVGFIVVFDCFIVHLGSNHVDLCADNFIIDVDIDIKNKHASPTTKGNNLTRSKNNMKSGNKFNNNNNNKQENSSISRILLISRISLSLMHSYYSARDPYTHHDIYLKPSVDLSIYNHYEDQSSYDRYRRFRSRDNTMRYNVRYIYVSIYLILYISNSLCIQFVMYLCVYVSMRLCIYIDRLRFIVWKD